MAELFRRHRAGYVARAETERLHQLHVIARSDKALQLLIEGIDEILVFLAKAECTITARLMAVYHRLVERLSTFHATAGLFRQVLHRQAPAGIGVDAAGRNMTSAHRKQRGLLELRPRTFRRRLRTEHFVQMQRLDRRRIVTRRDTLGARLQAEVRIDQTVVHAVVHHEDIGARMVRDIAVRAMHGIAVKEHHRTSAAAIACNARPASAPRTK